MKKSVIFASLAFGLAFVMQAQEKKELDRKAIKDMCGCFEITFKYTEGRSWPHSVHLARNSTELF